MVESKHTEMIEWTKGLISMDIFYHGEKSDDGVVDDDSYSSYE